MKVFRLVADVLFDAEDACAAATLLSQHFAAVSDQFNEDIDIDFDNDSRALVLDRRSKISLGPYKEEVLEGSIPWREMINRVRGLVREVLPEGKEHGITEVHSVTLTASLDETKFTASYTQDGMQKDISASINGYTQPDGPWWNLEIRQKKGVAP